MLPFQQQQQQQQQNRQQNVQDELLTGQDKQKKQEVDALLSEAMNNLTFQEREEQQEVLHGVAKDIAEEASFIEKALRELDAHIIRKKAGTVYEIAERMNPAYVNSRAFRIMFLRGNRYDAKASANQMLSFFELKQQLFGNDKLAQDITIDDLDEDDREALKAGFLQLTGRDTSNRQIVVQMPGIRKFRHLRNELRASFYTCMQALLSEQTQLKGIITIFYTVGNFKDRSKGVGFTDHSRRALSVPLHIAAIHFCLDDPHQYILVRAGLAAANAKLRARIRVHYGSHLECQYLLASYGISKELLPLTATYEVDMRRHLNWTEFCFRDSKDGSLKPPPCIEPNANDVLLMGYKTSNNLGNHRLRERVKELFLQYNAGTYEQKRHLLDGLIASIHNSGGRFLKQDKESVVWQEVTLKEARTKVTQIFRNYKRRLGTPRSTVTVPPSIVSEPMPDDVLFGRHQQSRGNELLHTLVKERFEKYESLDRGMKISVVDSIMQRIREEGGRFLEPDSNGWVELSKEQARPKVSKCLSNYRRHFKKAPN